MQFLPKYYDEYVIITEGVMCMIWLLSKGFNAMSSLGSHLTEYVAEILKRFGDKVIIIADADEAGNKYINQVKRDLPKARVFQSKVAKDIDDSRQVVPDLETDIRNIVTKRFYIPKYFQIGKYKYDLEE
jgi:DNA primase